MLLQGSSEQRSSQEETPQTMWESSIYKEGDEKRLLLSWGEVGFVRGNEKMGNPDICFEYLRGKDTLKNLDHQVHLLFGKWGLMIPPHPRLLSSSSNNVHTVKAPWRRQKNPRDATPWPYTPRSPNAPYRLRPVGMEAAAHTSGMLATMLQFAGE